MVWLLVWGMLPAFPELAASQAEGPSTAEVVTLEQAVALALEHNRPLKNAGLEVGKAADRIAAARTRLLPAL